MKTVIEVLEGARDLVARPGGWTQGCSARTAKGNPIGSKSDKAACFCAVGAIQRVAGRIRGINYAEAVTALGFAAGNAYIVHWNDAPYRTQAEVVVAFDRAIEAERARSAS